MTNEGIANYTISSGETLTITSAVPFAGMPIYQTTTEGTGDLATNSTKVIGVTVTNSVPNKELMEGTDAVAGAYVGVMPIREGLIVYMPVVASGSITCGDLIVVSATVGYVDTRTAENYVIGVAMDTVDNGTGSAGDLFVKVWCAPQYI